MFFDSYSKEIRMVFFFKDTEKKGQSEVLWFLAPDWFFGSIADQSGARIQKASLWPIIFVSLKKNAILISFEYESKNIRESFPNIFSPNFIVLGT